MMSACLVVTITTRELHSIPTPPKKYEMWLMSKIFSPIIVRLFAKPLSSMKAWSD